MSDDIRLAVTSAATRYPRRLLKQFLKFDPSRFKPASSATTKPAKSRSSLQQIDFVTLSQTMSLSPDHTLYHLQINLRDGSHLTLSVSIEL